MNPILEALRDAFPAPMGAARAEDLETGPSRFRVTCHYCPLGALKIAIDPGLGYMGLPERFPYHIDATSFLMDYLGEPIEHTTLWDNVAWEARNVTQNADLQPEPEMGESWAALGRLMNILGFEPKEGETWSQ